MSKVYGCTDPNAKNYNPEATDGYVPSQCDYDYPDWISFNLNPREILSKDPVTVSWKMNNSNFTELELMYKGKNIMPSDKKTLQEGSITINPEILGSNYYYMRLKWEPDGKRDWLYRDSSIGQTVKVVGELKEDGGFRGTIAGREMAEERQQEEEKEIPGCIDPEANNYNKDATVNDATCTYDSKPEAEKDFPWAVAGIGLVGVAFLYLIGKYK